MNHNETPKILMVITGGVAGFKAAALVSLLAKRKYQMQVVMSAAAQHFVAPATFAALAGSPVISEMFDKRFPLGPHIELARWADLMVVAPATAQWIGNAAHGLAGDLSSTLYLAFPKPVLVAPAMNAEMWAHPAVQRNIKTLQQDGVELVGPENGWQACRTEGSGRLSEAETIAQSIERLLKPTNQ